MTNTEISVKVEKTHKIIFKNKQLENTIYNFLRQILLLHQLVGKNARIVCSDQLFLFILKDQVQ